MRWITTLVLTALAAGPAAADPEVYFPTGERVTRDEVITRFRKGKGNEDKLPPAELVRVAADKFEPRSRPDLNAKPSGAPPVPFLTVYFKYGESGGQDTREGQHYLVATGKITDPDTQFLGWVPAVCLIRKTGECLRNEQSKVFLKAMAVNSIAYLTGKADGPAGDRERAQPPQFLLAPPPVPGPLNGVARFFDFYYVWADTDPNREDQGYALVAENPLVGNFQGNAEAFRREAGILGWVHKPRLCYWHTREALQWDDQNDKRTRPGEAYATREHALSVVDPRADRPPANTPEPAVERFAGTKPAKWDHDRMRYPRLDIRIPGDGAAEPRKVAQELVGKNTLRRIGLISNLNDKDGRPVMDAEVFQRLQAGIERSRQNLRRTEILFVIDRTGSMDKWWPETAKTVRSLVARVQGEKRSVAVGFCFYGDVNPSEANEGRAADAEDAVRLGGVRPGPLIDAAADARGLEAELRRVENRADKMLGGNPPEAVYYGLEAGIKGVGPWGREARWSRDARKLVVLCGDAGNHQLPADEEVRVHDRIAELLIPTPDEKSAGKGYQTPIEFYAIRANTGDAAAAAFETQSKALIGRIKARLPTASAHYYQTADETELLKKIDEQYEALRRQAEEVEGELARAGREGMTNVKHPQAVGILRRLAADNELDWKAIGNLTQGFDERFVYELDPATGTPQVRHMLLISKGELEKVTGIFDQYFNQKGQPTPTLEKLAQFVINAQAGEDPAGSEAAAAKAAAGVKGGSDQELAAAVRQAQIDRAKVLYGFSFTAKLSNYLGYDRPPGAPAPKLSEDQVTEFKQNLQKRWYLLKDILLDREQRYVKGGVDDFVGLKAEGEPTYRSRRFTKGGGRETFYWIDLEREWP